MRAEKAIKLNRKNPGEKPAKKMQWNHLFPETKAGEDSVERTTTSRSQKPKLSEAINQKRSVIETKKLPANSLLPKDMKKIKEESSREKPYL